jgi:hypothetical protein
LSNLSTITGMITDEINEAWKDLEKVLATTDDH